MGLINRMAIKQKIHETDEYASGDVASLLEICRDLLDEIEGLEERLQLLEGDDDT